MDDASSREIERALSAALSRRGVAGSVVVRGNVAELHAGGGDGHAAATVVAIELEWVNQWNLLPEDMRDPRADLAAHRLHNALLEAAGKKPRPERRTEVPPWLGKLAGPGIVVVLAAAALWWLAKANFFGSSGAQSSASASASASGPPSDADRERLGCEAARSRIYAGASMGVDVAGWVVELWLARPLDKGELDADPALTDAGSRLGALAASRGPSEVTIQKDEPSATLGLASAVVRMSGGHVSMFFDAKARSELERFAEELATKVGARHGALYARCAHLAVRDAGAWYFGQDDVGAIASILYAAGAHAEPPALDKKKLGGEGGALADLERRVATLDPKVRDERLAAQGGRLVRSNPESDAGTTGSSVRFPLGGPTRAAQLSRELAGVMGL